MDLAGGVMSNDQKFSLPETGQKMTITSASNHEHSYRRKFNHNESLTKQSVEIEAPAVVNHQEGGGHNRHRSSISMAGPHIIAQNEICERDMDS